MAKASEIKTGNILRINNELVTVDEWNHRTPGKGGAFYTGKFRNIKTGRIVEARMNTDEAVEICRVETNDYQYLYEEGDALVVMDNNTYEQFNVSKSLFGNAIKFLKEGMNVTIAFESDEEAIRLANNSQFGLASYFYSRDIGRIWKAAEALESLMLPLGTL